MFSKTSEYFSTFNNMSPASYIGTFNRQLSYMLFLYVLKVHEETNVCLNSDFSCLWQRGH